MFDAIFSSEKQLDTRDPEVFWNSLTNSEKEKRIDMLWDIAKRFNSKVRFQHRLSKIAQQNACDIKIVDIEEDQSDES